MMGKYLSFADKYVQKLKPIIESKAGVKLDDLLSAKDICLKPNYVDDAYHNTGMLVHRDCPDSIFVNQQMYEDDKSPLEKLSVAVAHELSHWVHDRLLDEKCRKRLWKKNSFMEGFAEYMSLDHLLRHYNLGELEEVRKRKDCVRDYADFSPNEVPYERGYKFFKKVLSVVGADKVFDVARSPPISEAEVKMPLLYLLRNYPIKGAMSIPKFLTKGLKTKIIKRRDGFAPFDFNKRVKAVRIDQPQ